LHPLQDYEDLPFSPGASPFHVKGIAYRGHIDYAEKNVPGGSRAVNAAFRNPELRAFFDQPFLAASWYDALPMVAVWHATARVLQQPSIEFLKVRTRHQALQDINGVYRLILNIASAETVALRIPRAVGKYFDFGTTDARVIAPGVVRMEQTQLPLLLAPWFTVVADTFVRVALELAGAASVQFRRQPHVETGKVHGIPVATFTADVQFGAPQGADRTG
jgi:hypothetical protein